MPEPPHLQPKYKDTKNRMLRITGKKAYYVGNIFVDRAGYAFILGVGGTLGRVLWKGGLSELGTRVWQGKFEEEKEKEETNG